MRILSTTLRISTLLLLISPLFAQKETPHFTKDIAIEMGDQRDVVLTIQTGNDAIKDFCAFSMRLDGDGLSAENVQCLVRLDGQWKALGTFEEESLYGRYVSELLFVDAGTTHFDVKIKLLDAASRVKSGKIHLFSPSGTISTAPPQPDINSADAVPCPQPNYVPRASWGAAWNLNGNIYTPPAVYTTVTHLIVHHSAGSNTSSNWPGVVAAIFDYHVNTNGWADVGYNWLIDPQGALYEGRGGGNNVRGAHMCGYNTNTMGVCYLGNFQLIAPPPPGLQTLVQLLAWKCGNSNINPLGSGPIMSYPGTMKTISGHKDGCEPSATECPGDLLHPLLDTLRKQVYSYINTVCNPASGVLSWDSSTETPVISPNPAGNTFVLHWPSTFAAETCFASLFDASGRQIWADIRVIQNNQVFQSDAFAPGVYWLHVASGSGGSWLKLLK